MRKFSTSLFIALLALLALPERVWAENVSVKFLVRVEGSNDVPTLYLWYSNNGSDVKPNGAWADTPTTSETETINGNTYYKYTITVPTETDLQLITKKSGNVGGNEDQSADSDPFQINSGASVNYVLVEGSFSKGTKPKIQVVETGSETGHTFYLGCATNNWEKNEGYKFTSESSSGPYTYTLAKESVSAITDGYFYVSILPYYNGKQWDKDGKVERICPTNGDGTELPSSASNSNAQVSTTFTSWKVKYVENATDYVFTFNHSNMSFSVVPTLVSETKYTVTISAGEGGSVSPSGDQQIGSTSVNITATPNSGYKFVNWTADDGVSVADPSSPTTTVTATKAGTLTATFNKSSTPDPTPTPTPILGNNFYLAGDFLNTDDGINYACRYFKLSEIAAATAARDGVEEYSINIPTTLTVNVQILATDEKGSTALYGPSGQVTINKNNPSGNGSTTGTLVAATQTLTNYFKFEDRTTGRTTETPNENDGLYTITVTVTNGVPTNYTIEHNPLTRVAYYLPNTPDASVKESLNTRSQTTAAFNNVFFGRVYLPAGVACYVLSNYLGKYDTDAYTDTKTKLYLQGNKTGGNPDTNADGAEKDKYTKVYPITNDAGTATGAQPFVFSATDIVAMNLEYAPRRGNNTYQAENIYGEVIRSQKTTQTDDETVVTIPTIKVLKMVGPAVGDETWDYSQGVVMNYNMAEQCWEATINTTAAAGAKFRFVANNTWENSWQENGTAEADKARIPYNVDGVGHAATPADPNEVSYISSLKSKDDRVEDYDIIFNRDPGKWRVRFYFTSQQIDENNYKYIFKYTINGYKSVLRTYCSDRDEKPTDESIKIYGAYAFEGNEAAKSGKIKLYEMNYIPANEGVILYSANVIDEATIAAYTPKAGETKYKNIPNADYKNYLVGTIDNTTVNASVFNGNNERTHRNFFFNYLKNTGYYTEGDTDYLGFFRIKSGSTCKANHAYLSLPTSVLAWNGQTFGQVMDAYEASGEPANLTKGMRIVFSDGSDWEDNTTTAISVVQQAKPADNAYYTLQGVRVAAPAKGIYIHNGKKIIIR